MKDNITPPTEPAGLTTGRAILWGSAGFCGVSVAAFSIWAGGSGWFRHRGGEAALYAAIAIAFVGLTGLFLHPLLVGPRRIRRFYAAFTPAFLLYAVVWSGFWFWLKFGLGEWLGAFFGSAGFVAIMAWRLGRWHSLVPVTVVFFALHTAGYFAGGWCMAQLLALARQVPPPVLNKGTLITCAMLSWGVMYGLGFGAGLGYLLAVLQRPSAGATGSPQSR